MSIERTSRPHDLVLFGATGFTGRLVAEYLARAAPPLRWALAGRDHARLEAVRRDLAAIAPGCATLPILVGDAHDSDAMDAIATRTRVVCTTVGPFAKHGSELVGACARAGTDYCDITGEVQWIRRMIDANHDIARGTGARIVHTCGFDSIPSDLGTLLVQDEMLRRHGRRAGRVTSYFGESKGKFSGGTVASLLNVLDEAVKDRAVLRVIGDPYALDPRPRQGGADRGDDRGPGYDRGLGVFTAPFLMAGINTRVVRRTNALLGYAWGHDFRYREVMSFPRSARGAATATAVAAGLAGFLAAAAVPPLRKLVEKKLPAPGEGPSAAERAAGYFVVRVVGEAAANGSGEPARLIAKVSDRADPGYGSTSKMLAEAALCLALDDLPTEGGVLTPATAMGARLIERLRRAGLTFEVGPPS